MAQPIFAQQNVTVKNVFTAKQAKLTFAPTDITGVLVQGVNFTYAQNITRLYEISGQNDNEQNVYYVVGRTQGQLQLNRVVGPDATIRQMYVNFGDACKACTNKMTLDIGDGAGECCKGQQIKYILKGCALQQVGISLQAQDMIINEQCQVMFSGLDYE